MNVQLKDITVTARDGRVSHLDQVYIRGSHVRFFIVPDMLRLVRRWDYLFLPTIHAWSFALLSWVLFIYGGFAMLIVGIIGTHLCSEVEALRVEVLVWREEGLLLAEQELVGGEDLQGDKYENMMNGRCVGFMGVGQFVMAFRGKNQTFYMLRC